MCINFRNGQLNVLSFTVNRNVKCYSNFKSALKTSVMFQNVHNTQRHTYTYYNQISKIPILRICTLDIKTLWFREKTFQNKEF